MDSTSSFIVSQEEFILFHRIDRELYKILVIKLYREPVETMQLLAMWLWLERAGFRNVVKKIMSLPNILINEVADETVTCLNCINNGLTSSFSSEGSDIPLLHSLMEKEISLQFLYEKRVDAIQGVAKMMQDVCVRALTDIMQQAMVRNSTEKMMEAQKVVTQSSEKHLWFGSIGPSSNMMHGNKAELAVQDLIADSEVPADDRTLFVTFSKGYRVEEWEVREFFTVGYGDCVEALYMQEVQPNEQALFARIVFHKMSIIDMILRGATKAKFTINGKHVWARKFVPKRTVTKSFLPTFPIMPGESSGSGL
ncbi:uncharacterized protein LOC133305481 [Gastrolobium bilobum]|uniref:uncharacterized protein LOC133305481 n=1 Tax=Gastrolobium bilobum TaxID=150636 RepID=UPI002AB26D1A|nr:uncharacterized protein LOC133305481 [Gastrolobium bilobum]